METVRSLMLCMLVLGRLICDLPVSFCTQLLIAKVHRKFGAWQTGKIELLVIVEIFGMHVRIPVPKKVGEWTDKCRLTVQRCKFVYRVWSKWRNKENFDSLVRNGALDEFADEILDFMNCDTKSVVDKLKICEQCRGLKGRAKTKLMRASLQLLIKEIKKGFQRNLEYLNTHHKSVKNDSFTPT